MTAGIEGQSGLKAKEKILVQLYLHRCEPDDGVFPFEVTQKGLSEHLGLRRSHVAIALQDLVEDGLVVVAKGHVEGADRRQNAYCVTSKGIESAGGVRERLLEIEVTFEDANGTSKVKVSEIVNARKASLASVINQLDRGGPVRDEITVMTAPERKLISVFCPTCKKQIEVDNVFFEEEVGFDCPGCGRPYRIVPAIKREETLPELAAVGPQEHDTAKAVSIAAAISAMIITYLIAPFCLTGCIGIGVVAGLITWFAMKTRRPKAVKPRKPLGATASVIALAPIALVIWHLTVARIDAFGTLLVLGPIWGGLVVAYIGVRKLAPEFVGDLMMSAGVALVLVAGATMFVIEFWLIEVGMAVTLAISGAVLIVLSTFHPMDSDARHLDIGAAVGVLLLLLVALALSSDAPNGPGMIAMAAAAFTGAVLIYLRVARETTGSKDISTHMVAAAMFSGAVCLLVMGALLMDGGNLASGLIVVAAASPFAYDGLTRVLSEHWRRRLPLVAVFLVAGLLTLTGVMIF